MYFKGRQCNYSRIMRIIIILTSENNCLVPLHLKKYFCFLNIIRNKFIYFLKILFIFVETLILAQTLTDS